LVEAVRRATNDGETLVRFMASVLRGKVMIGRRPSIRDQIEAATWLADRGFGKPASVIGISADIQHTSTIEQRLRAMTPDERQRTIERYVTLLARTEAPPPSST
jgi:hypothetical protein